ncbi:MAG: hypothetical protein KGZ25_04630 [Planctomycetes bacterium]|nr:hypothetical protein [Planctomycetota bacterium]
MKHSQHDNIIFAASYTDSENIRRELVVTENLAVFFTTATERADTSSADQIQCGPREANRFLGQVGALGLEDWEKRYGKGNSLEPGSWMVLLEWNGTLRKWQGSEEYPPDWENLCKLIERFSGRSFD